jgi:ABC-type glycerol-3-phosphate transport system permease component
MAQTMTSPPKQVKKSKAKPIDIVLYTVLIVGAFIMISPIVWMSVSAFKSEAEINIFPPTLLPREPSLESLKKAWARVGPFLLNSVFVTGVSTPISVLTSVLVGFVLSKYEFRGRNLIFYGILSTMMLPGTVLLIPNYQIIIWLGWINTYAALIVPGAFSTFGIFMMRQFMHTVPDELLDAARIDGASEPRIFAQIVIPLVKPALAMLSIFQFMGVWNAYFWPLIVLTKEKMYTVPVGLAGFAAGYEPNFASRNAGAFIAIVPVIIVFVLFQRHIIKGMALTGMAGG